MKRRIFLLCCAALPFAAWAAPYAGPTNNVEIWRTEWRDAKRERAVPVKIYYPQGAGPFPVIVFSHGLGGSREGYQYLGEYWAAHGYVAVHLQHLGSDDALWKGGAGMQGMRGGVNLKNAIDRALDVKFALDQLEVANAQESALRGKLDLQKIGMAGHSFGANTTLLICGMSLGGRTQSQADPRIKAAIAMSAPMPALKDYDTIYRFIKVPMLHLTGTKDETPFDTPGSKAADRRLPFDHIKASGQYLVTFTDGDHMLFAGQRIGGRDLPDDARNHALIQQSTTAFWDTYLKGDERAKSWLQNDLSKELGAAGVFEQKP